MARKNIKTVDIELELFSQIVKHAKEKNLSIHKFTNSILEQILTKNEFVKKIAPKLSLIQVEEDLLIIRDDTAKKMRLATINIRNGKLWCDVDDSGDCEHVHYSLTLPELVNLKDKLKQL